MLKGSGPKPVEVVAKEHGGDAGNIGNPTAISAQSNQRGESSETHDSEDQSKGTGEQHVKTTGFAADGGDFDATKPGAGIEADRKTHQISCCKRIEANRKTQASGSRKAYHKKATKIPAPQPLARPQTPPTGRAMSWETRTLAPRQSHPNTLRTSQASVSASRPSSTSTTRPKRPTRPTEIPLLTCVQNDILFALNQNQESSSDTYGLCCFFVSLVCWSLGPMDHEPLLLLPTNAFSVSTYQCFRPPANVHLHLHEPS